MKRSASWAKVEVPQKAVAAVNSNPKETLTHVGQKRLCRGLLKGDLVYTTVETGSGYIATCSFSQELSSTLNIHEAIIGAVAPTKKAAEHNAASTVLSMLGVESEPNTKRTKGPTNSATAQSFVGGAPKLQAPQKAAAAVNSVPKETLAHTAQKRCGRGLVKGDVVYTTMETGSGYVATCSFSEEVSGTLGIYEAIIGAEAPTKKAAEQDAASSVLSLLGIESEPNTKQIKGPTSSAPAQSFVGGAHGGIAITDDGEFDGTEDYKGLLLRQLQTLFSGLSETDLIYTTQPSGPASASWQGCVQIPCLEEMSTYKPSWSPVPSSGEIVSKKKSMQFSAFAALRTLSTGLRPILPPQSHVVPRRAKNSPCQVFALFKPRGMTTTMSTDPLKGGRDMAAWINSIMPGLKLCIIGGLDKFASGLLLVTSDGHLAQDMAACHGCEKEYWCGVDVASDVDADALVSDTCSLLLGGFEIDHPHKEIKMFASAKEARQLLPEEQAHAGLGEGAGAQDQRLLFSVTVDIGSFQTVKRMMDAAGAPPVTQHLERIGSLRLADLQLRKPGTHIELSGEDVELLRSSCASGQVA
ncbi:unnamed protein product [Polarella glacialis]|uniref:DRBM domain-containing protein n=1 Tax=Polarella glacialis TaxID=89957 RepID=A0A813JHB0_POLGL|nr:unnamed protein product [Polarella glacialis]